MKFDTLADSLLNEMDVERLAKQDSREVYDDNMKDLEDERDIFEILGDFRLNKPELFDKFVQRLDDKLFVKMIKDMRGVSL